MAAKREIPNADHIVNSYISGVPIGKIIKEAGISDCLFSRLLRDAGVKRRTRQESYAARRGRPVEKRRWQPENLSELLADYRNGMSEKSVAEKHCTERSVIRRILIDNGIKPRTRSEAESLKWKAIKQDQSLVERQCGAAWEAANSRDNAVEQTVIDLYQTTKAGAGTIARITGTTRANIKRLIRKNNLAGYDSAERRAYGVERATNKSIASPYEIPILLGLQALGANPVYQHAIGPCNVDIAFPELRVSVEVERRYFGDSNSLKRQRLEYLFNAGWRVLIAYDPRKLGFDNLLVAKKLVAALDMLRSDESISGQYGVIYRDGKPYARSSRHFNGWSRIPRL